MEVETAFRPLVPNVVKLYVIQTNNFDSRVHNACVMFLPVWLCLFQLTEGGLHRTVNKRNWSLTLGNVFAGPRNSTFRKCLKTHLYRVLCFSSAVCWTSLILSNNLIIDITKTRIRLDSCFLSHFIFLFLLKLIF